jgi:DNA invertase Pin-like site-specific DNA recombinase
MSAVFYREEFIDMEIGYVRVSSLEQNEDRQMIALEGAGVNKYSF